MNLTFAGHSPIQLAIYAGVAVVLLVLGFWNLGTPLTLYAGRLFSRTQRPTALDSDRRAPVGAQQWMDEVLSAVEGAPDELKLAILTDPDTTVATALKRHRDFLKGAAR